MRDQSPGTAGGPVVGRGTQIWIGVGIIALVSVVGVLVAPWITLAGGITVLGLGVFWVVPHGRGYFERLLGLSPRSGSAHVLRACAIMAVGVCLVIASTWVISGRERSLAADRQFDELIADGQSALKDGRLSDAGNLAARAAAMPGRRGNAELAHLQEQIDRAHERARIVNAKVASDSVLRSALTAIEERQYQEAAPLLERYTAMPHASETETAKALLREVGVVTSKEESLALLEGLSDEEFSAWTKSGTLPARLRPTSKAMADAYRSALTGSTGEATRQRADRRKREEAERLARLQAERQQLTEGSLKEAGRITTRLDGVRLVPFKTGDGSETQAVCVDWTNMSDSPIRTVYATVRAFDRHGGELYSVNGEEVYIGAEDQPGVPPGGSHVQPNGNGFALPPAVGPRVARVTVSITRWAEESRGEAERRRQTKAREEAASRAADEYDADGLVLLRSSVQGKTDRFSIDITGTVVNRRGREVRYAQITFKLFDESGAQVGTALANITNLEAGGRWNFKAVGFVKARSYKFAELVGR